MNGNIKLYAAKKYVSQIFVYPLSLGWCQ